MNEIIINGIVEESQEVNGQMQYAKDGISVIAASINTNGHLIVTLSNGTSIDAGAIDPRTVYQKFIDDNNLKQRNWVDLSFVGGEYYYTDFLQAVADVNADTTENSTTDSTNAVCQIFKNDEITVLRLLSDLSVTTNVVFEKSVIFDINGYTVSCSENGEFGERGTAVYLCSVIFYGAKLGSLISGTDVTAIINIQSKYFYILGGKYLLNCVNIGTAPITMYKTTSEINCEIYNAYMYTTSQRAHTNTRVAQAFYCSPSAYAKIKLYNSKFEVISLYTKVYTLYFTGTHYSEIYIDSCSISANSPDLGDKSGVGIVTAKNPQLILKNSKIYGITSGIDNNCILYLQNCKCYSPYHGGVYNTANGFLYAENCEFHRSICPDGYTPTGWAASYFGYGSTAYLNDCSFILDTDGDTSDGIAIKQDSGTIPTKVFISNSELPKLRCDNGQYVYLGEGISDTIKNATVNGTKVLTDENYSTYINKETSQSVVDIEYEPTSRSPQSGIAVAEAVTEAKDYTDTKIGDIDTALDNIISLQNSYIGGNS